MSRLRPFQEQQGFVTFAQNTEHVDYLKLAYVQAMSIKLVMPDARYAVIVDEDTLARVEDKHRTVFDYVIPLPVDNAKEETWKLSNEPQVFWLTPFKETIKLESDLVFTRSIEHWWTMFRLRNVVLSLGCRDYTGQLSDVRRYRRLFDDNQLPDTYNGLMYFRYSQEATNFFETSSDIYHNWDYIKENVLINCRDELPTTDVVYALAALREGIESCTLPGVDFINFAHMKNAINNWPGSTPWTEMVVSELELPMVRINNSNQYHTFHYQDKNWVTDEVVERFEHEFRR
jgi:hypothetical protein